MKLTAHIPPHVKIIDVIAALRELGLEQVRYQDGELRAGSPEEEHHGNADVVKIHKYRGQHAEKWRNR